MTTTHCIAKLPLVALLALACSTVQAMQVEDYEILALGDSITLGYKAASQGGPRYDGLGTLEGNGARIGGYEPELEEVFALYKSDTKVYNWGIAGDRTDQMLNRTDSVLNSRNADYLLIMGGTNDQILVSPSSTIFNLGVMIDKARARNTTPILATITYRNYKTDQVTSRNPGIIDLAQSKNVVLADQWATTEPPNFDVANAGDGLHISFEGDRMLAETWFEAITGLSAEGPPPFDPSAINLLLLDET